MPYISLSDRFSSVIKVLYDYFPEEQVTAAINHVIQGQPIRTDHEIRPVVYGLYFHQYTYIPAVLPDIDFTPSEIIFMQAIGQICTWQVWEFSVDAYLEQLWHTLQPDTQLQSVCSGLYGGKSWQQVWPQLDLPILYNLFCFLYIPNNIDCQLQLLQQISPSCPHKLLHFPNHVFHACLTAPYVCGSHQRLYASWRGQFQV